MRQQTYTKQAQFTRVLRIRINIYIVYRCCIRVWENYYRANPKKKKSSRFFSERDALYRALERRGPWQDGVELNIIFFSLNLLLSDISGFSQKKPITEPDQPREKNLDPDTQHLVDITGTVSRDFLLLVFFHETVSPQPQSSPFGPFRIFPKIRGDIRKSRAWGKMIHKKKPEVENLVTHRLHLHLYTLYRS